MDELPLVRVCRQCETRIARDNPGALCAACQRRSRGLLAGAPDVPPEFWDDVGLRAALNARHMGLVVRAYRRHPFHGRAIPQGIVAGWVFLTQTQLSRIESGPPLGDLAKLIQWAEVLRIPGHLLWFKLPEAAASATPPVPVAWPALTIDDLPHMTAAFGDARRYFDGDIIAVLRRQLDAAKADDGQHGPAAALPPVLTVLGAVQACVGEVKPAVRAALLSVGADGAEFVGWLYRDLHDLRTAGYWYDRAIEWAQEADDPAMQGYVLLRKSQLAYDRRDPLRVLTLAEAARRSGELPLRVRAEVTQQEALGLAMTGEPLAAVERRLDVARQVLGRSTPDDAELVGGGFTPGTLRLRSTACYTEAGKPGRAATILGSILAGHGLPPRDVGYFQARQAAALALIGEPDEAARLGVAAAQVAQATQSGRTTTVLSDTLETLARWRTRPQVRELRDVLTTRSA